MNEKNCGSCRHFDHGDMDGYGWCYKQSANADCEGLCSKHEYNYNGWTELTNDNVDEINADLIVVTDGTCYKMANDWHASLSTLAKLGGYYYYVLPELKIE